MNREKYTAVSVFQASLTLDITQQKCTVGMEIKSHTSYIYILALDGGKPSLSYWIGQAEPQNGHTHGDKKEIPSPAENILYIYHIRTDMLKHHEQGVNVQLVYVFIAG